jgi:hypothetical protein
MFYLLLIIPHLVALTALLGYAVRSAPREANDEPSGESSGPAGEPKPPPNPPPLAPPAGGPPLPDAAPLGRRLRDPEEIYDLRPRRQRRQHPDHPPKPAPKMTGARTA